MKIAIIADPEIPVPPILYGGIERIIHLLIKGLVDRGIEVSLFAHQDSNITGKLFAYKKNKNQLVRDVSNILLITKSIPNQNYDLIHSFGRLAYLLPQLPMSIPKIMSYQREPTISQIKKAICIAKKNSLYFTGCSNYIANQIKPYAPASGVFNAITLSTYDFNDSNNVNQPLIFLGRIEPAKGTHIAIEVAIKTGRKLIIAGNIPLEYQGYFDEMVKPHLDESISYVGAVNDEQKNRLLGQAVALLMPITWNEPFGIVMIEAMACGTPVIAFNRGSVPEVVQNGINGFIAETTEDMISAVTNLPKIDRKKVRHDAEIRFSADVIVDQYLKIYQSLIK